MIQHFRPLAVAAAAAWISFGGMVRADQPPRLPLSIARGANDLQRAAWACEGGAPVLTPAAAPAAGRMRFFLSGGGESGTDEAPLVLVDGKLSGIGWLSDDRGWSVIRFQCSLARDLRRATAFNFWVIAKAAAPSGDPTAPDSLARPSAKIRTWMVQPATATLSHSVPETDDRDFRADCVPHSGEVSILLTQSVPWLKKDGYVVVTLGDGTRSGLYVARAKPNEEGGAFVPDVSVAASDPLFTLMAEGKTLLVNVGRDVAYGVPLAGATEPVKAFSAVCRR